MKTLRALGERVGGVVRRPRVYAALALPLAIPLFLAAVNTDSVFGPSMQASLAPPALRYRDLREPDQIPLPEHSLVLTMEKNDTLSALLQAGGLSSADSVLLARALSKSIDVRRLRPGHLVRFHYDRMGVVDAVQMKVSGWGDLGAVRSQDGFTVEARAAETRSVETSLSATIERSLYEAVRDAGEGPQLVQQIVDVFQWDIDFFSLQKGDSFSLIVSKQFAGSDLTGYGPITAARFTHRGSIYEAFRHEAADGSGGYYSADASPLRKQFLKAPLKFTRVTSGFTKRRFHPVLKYFRPHYGVDYGAPIGTPVMTTADGVVVEARYKSGDGNFVRVRHSSRIETYYLHLSKFAKGIGKGSKVRQGQVIAYVGKTGLATGPHLDYRVRENGDWLNPLKLRSITPDPLRGASRRAFLASVERLQPRLTASSDVVAEKHVQARALF